MNAPWFDPNLYAWIPGTAFGVLGGVFGSLAGTLAPKGRARAAIMMTFWGLIVLSISLLAVAFVALWTGQPYGIWYGFGLPGLLGSFLFPALRRRVRLVYEQAELRKAAARDLQ